MPPLHVWKTRSTPCASTTRWCSIPTICTPTSPLPIFSLEEAEREQDEKQQADPEKAEQFSVREFYHSLHRFNTFVLKTPAISSQLCNKNLYLGLACGQELSDELQNEVRKNMTGAYLSLRKHTKLFFNGGIDEDMENLEDEIYEMFTEYVKRFSSFL